MVLPAVMGVTTAGIRGQSGNVVAHVLVVELTGVVQGRVAAVMMVRKDSCASGIVDGALVQ